MPYPARLSPVTHALLGAAVILTTLAIASPHALADTRELPDFAGREQRTSAGDVLIWVPRVVLAPLYLVTEFGIRRPLGALISLAERNQVQEVLYDFFTFTPDHKVGLVPTFFVDFGFKPSAGIYFFWDDLFVDGHDVRLHAATWGPEWLSGSITDRIALSAASTLQFDLSGTRRGDYRFYGEGPSTHEDDLSRYGASRIEGRVSFLSRLGAPNLFSAASGVRSVGFHAPAGSRASTEQLVAAGRFAEPESLRDGYTAVFNRLQLHIDTRRPHTHDRVGLRLEASVEQGTSVDKTQGWIKWGGSLTGYLDLTGHARVLSLTLTSLFSDPLTARAQPFTELVQLGGNGPMPGFLPGRLAGKSALVATLAYRWPIWVWLNGTIQTAVGDVFDEHLEDFRWSLLRFSSAIGIETSGISDNPIEILFGIGTETFAAGTQLTALQLVFGTTHDYL